MKGGTVKMLKVFTKSYVIGLVIILGITANTQTANAWGVLGHKTTAQIAWNILLKNPATADKVRVLLQGQQMSDISVWPDQIKSQGIKWRHASPYHYENIDDGMTYLQRLHQMTAAEQKRGGAVMAMLVAENTILDVNAPLQDRSTALSFLVHIIGDIHQPLHTGPIADQGGNAKIVQWNGRETNLHSLWDGSIIYSAHPDVLTKSVIGTKKEHLELAKFLMKKFEKLDLKNEDMVRYDNWIAEAMSFRPEMYKYIGEPEGQYVNRFVDRLDKLMYLAGVRMAAKIQSLVDGSARLMPIQGEINDLKTSISEVVGDFNSIIRLKPLGSANPADMPNNFVMKMPVYPVDDCGIDHDVVHEHMH